MRIGVLTTSYPHSPGDPSGSFVRGFARWLAGQGHSLEVLAAATAGDGPSAVHDPGIDVHWVRYAPRPLERLFSRSGSGAPEALEAGPGSWPLAGAFSLALAAAALRRGRDWDALVSHWLVPSGVVAAGLARGRPHLAIAHSGDVHLILRLGLAPLVARALACADVVFSSAELQARFVARAPLPSRAVAMGVELGPPPAPVERAAARARLAPRPGRLLVGFLGRLVPIKGVALLIEAARHVPLSLRIAGDGPLAAQLAAAARTVPDADIQLLGPLSADGPARRDFYAGLDLLAVPSVTLKNGRSEGTPVVIFEALAHGVPVLGSATGGIAAAIGEAGVAVPQGDPLAIAAALRVLSEDRAALVSLTAAAHARAATLSWSQVGPLLARNLKPQ